MEKKVIKIKKVNTIPQVSIAITCLAFFFVLWLMVEMGHASVIDDPVRNAVLNMREDWLTPIMKAITYMGNWQTITAICILLLIFRKTRMTYGLPLAIGAIIVSAGNKAIKAIVLRPRPDEILFLIEQEGWSFPSGHSITSMFFFGMVIWLIRRNVQNRKWTNVLTALLAIPMVLIGISRVYLGVHYPTDVFAGWCLGIMVIAIMTIIIEKASNKINK